MTLAGKYEEYRVRIGESRIDKTYEKYADSWLSGYLYIGLLTYVLSIVAFIPMLSYTDTMSALMVSITSMILSQLYLRRFFKILQETPNVKTLKLRGEENNLYIKLANKLKGDYFFRNNIEIFISYADFKLEEIKDKIIQFSIFPIIFTAISAISLELLAPNLNQVYQIDIDSLVINFSVFVTISLVSWLAYIIKSTNISTHYGLKKLLLEIREELSSKNLLPNNN